MRSSVIYEAAVLVAGDGDYQPLVEEVQRLGKRVHLAFFGGACTSNALRLVCDEFVSLERSIRDVVGT